MELPWFLLFMRLSLTAASCGLDNLPSEHQEGAHAGDTVFNFTATEPIWLVSGGRGYFNISDYTLYAEKELDMSEDQDLCVNQQFDLGITCQGIEPASDIYTFVLKPIDSHDPKFPYPEFSRTIPESATNGTAVIDFSSSNETSAIDKDCGANSLFYSMASNPYVRFVNGQKGTMFTITTFDYESGINSHTVNISVTSDGKIGIARFTLNISDVDDEDPVFTFNAYTLEVEEEKTHNQWMDASPAIRAFDQDLGVNTPLAYNITSSVPPLDALTINNNTGQLWLNQTLDREDNPIYTVILETYQLDNPRRSATSTLTIEVKDVNDNRPSFNPTTYTASILEHSVEGSNIISVTAVDIDEHPYNLFNYTLEPESHIFKIDPQTGYIQVLNSTALDRETQDTFTVNVTAHEQNISAPWLTPCQVNCTATVSITLLDANDHSPVFSETTYSFSSSNQAGDHVGTVNASDEDFDENGRVSYSIAQASDFSVNEEGNITQDRPVANLRQTVFLIEACDNGESRRCSQELVTVTFPEQNVTSTKKSVNVTENVAFGTIVYAIPTAYSGYSLLLSTYTDTFKIVEQDTVHQVVTAADIDRENTSSYTLVIDVKNGIKTEANITLDVVVLDVNDNAPIFNMSDYSFSVPVNDGDVLGVVEAYDLDDGTNGDITYSIQGTESSRRFAIDGNTGKITLKIVPESPDELLIVATDGGVIPLKTTTVVKVVVAGAQNAYTLFHAPAEKDEVEKDKDRLVGEMSAILNISVDIGNIQAVDVDNGASSYFRLSARESTVHRDDLRAKVNSNYEKLLALFSPYQNNSEEVFTTPFIALLAVGIAVAVVSVIAIIAIVYINRKRNRHHKRLMRNLSKHDTIYEAQAVEETIGDGQSVHSQTGSTQELLEEGPHANGDAIAVLNEGFEDDDNNNTKAGDENQDTLTQYTHVEEEAEEGGMTEGVIVDFGSEDTPEQEHVETQGLPNPDYGDGEEVISNPDYAVVVKKEAPETKTAVLVFEDEDLDEDVHELVDGEKDEEVPSREGDQILEPPQEDETPLPPVKEDEDPPDLNVNESIEDEDEDSGDGFPPPPPTPPRVRKSDPEDEEPYEAQDEPEPDYAKKVRFSEVRVQVIPDPKEEDAVESGVGGEGTEGAETDEEDNTTKSDRPFEEIQNPAEDIDEGDGTFIMTAL
ncbi:protocadherin Fat 4-like isoform X1 [Haliotis rufescens]|uniref:protocadherin Fat 4-like isoform X1 n=1 Tax=Haliotis rufescens TaxID=6454 RepID=UPI00201EF77C|nr:protocadherin Fat 4-like isoform X1 [Haliotis rufescens]